MKTQCDKKANSSGFEIGDKVWFYQPPRKKGRSLKLERSYTGPYTVINRINDLVYRIQLSPRSKVKIVSSDRLDSFYSEDSARDDQNC
ncbi:hypothetical protein Trydic_g2537 [Trypoxylus dichotomus]